MSTDTVKLTETEKGESRLKCVPFHSLPAVKVGKLAINRKLSNQAARKGYGSFALDIANTYAFEVYRNGVACRFLTVDADVEYNPSTFKFYEKNGFQQNESFKSNKVRKTISMRRDIFA